MNVDECHLGTTNYGVCRNVEQYRLGVCQNVGERQLDVRQDVNDRHLDTASFGARRDVDERYFGAASIGARREVGILARVVLELIRTSMSRTLVP